MEAANEPRPAVEQPSCGECRAQTACLLECVSCDRRVCLWCCAENEDGIVICKVCNTRQPHSAGFFESTDQCPWCENRVSYSGSCSFCAKPFKACYLHAKQCGHHKCTRRACGDHHHCKTHAPRCSSCNISSSHVLPRCGVKGCSRRLCSKCRQGHLLIGATLDHTRYVCDDSKHREEMRVPNCQCCDRVDAGVFSLLRFITIKVRIGHSMYLVFRLHKLCVKAAEERFYTARLALRTLPKELRYLIYQRMFRLFPRCDACRTPIAPLHPIELRPRHNKVFLCSNLYCYRSYWCRRRN